MEQYGAVAIIAAVAFIFPFIPLIASSILQKRKPSKEKDMVYECGVDTIGRSWVQFKTSYFLYALAFVVFDVETVFLYPWAVVFRRMDIRRFCGDVHFYGHSAAGTGVCLEEGGS